MCCVDGLLASVADPWEDFVRNRSRQLKEIVSSHRSMSKNISSLCVSVGSHRNECLKIFGGLNVQIALKKQKDDEGKQKHKKQSYFTKLNKNLFGVR